MAKAWSGIRLALYRAKCAAYIKQRAEQELCRRVMRNLTDPIQIKARVMSKKLVKVIKLQSVFDEIRSFGQVEGELRARSSSLESRRESR